jgi:N6-L-threonylcarbamoyladenine synthase
MELEKKGCLNKRTKTGLLSSFQHSVIDAMVATVVQAVEKARIRRVVCGGGVIANRYLREKLQQQPNIQLLMAPREYATDNAAIVAGLGFYLYNKKSRRSNLKLQAEAN